MSHAIHMIIVNGDSAEKAEEYAREELKGWGTEDNYFSVCAVLSEDGADDDRGYPFEDWPQHWGFSFLTEPLAERETLFARAVQHMRERALGPIFLQTGEPYSYRECTAASAKDYLAAQIQAFDPATSPPSDLRRISNNCLLLFHALQSRAQIAKNPDRFELYGYEFAEPGLTDLTIGSQGRQRYLVMIDMHS